MLLWWIGLGWLDFIIVLRIGGGIIVGGGSHCCVG